MERRWKAVQIQFGKWRYSWLVVSIIFTFICISDFLYGYAEQLDLSIELIGSIDYDGQFTMANSTPWLMHMDKIAYDKVINQKEPLQGLGRSFFIKERLQNEEDLLSKSHGIMYQLSSTILEMFSLVNAEYFVGGFYSTLSLNVCLLRGLDRIMDSNMCWMLIHPNSHYAIPPPMDQTVNIPTDNSQDEKINIVSFDFLQGLYSLLNDADLISPDFFFEWWWNK